jgi:glycosyltransferase involved in cell wall biosynthesis
MKIKIAVILATHNGERFIAKQLDSIINQKGNYVIDIFLSDDNSKDKTLLICKKKKYTKNIKKIFTVNFNSFSKNFLNLVRKVPKSYDYYAFSDQDDIWLKDKFKRAIKILKLNYSLYCSRTILVNNKLQKIGYSPLFKKKPSFSNALVQSIAGGNTMVFNKKIFRALLKFKVFNAPSHDWLLYIITTGIGEKVYYDKISKIYYRQHANNLVGTNKNLKDKFKRLFILFRREFRNWTNFHIKFLEKNINLIFKNNREILLHFKKIRDSKIYLLKCIIKKDLKIYRQTYLGQFMLIMALIFKLI